MFGRSPFVSSFFGGRDPFAHMDSVFAHMDNMMSQMMAGADPFGHSMFGQMGMLPPMMQQEQQRRLQAAPVSIEEVYEDEQHNGAVGQGSSAPIVEEPEDAHHHAHDAANGAGTGRSGAPPARGQQQPQQQAPQQRRQQQQQQQQALYNGGGGLTFSYSSSSYTAIGGRDGVVYQASNSTRVGPNGVRESRSSVRDGASGRASMTLSRGLGEKERTVTRTRVNGAQETQQQVLRGLSEAEAPTFDEQWRRAADANGFGVFGGVGGDRQRLQPQQQLQQYALPAAPTNAAYPPPRSVYPPAPAAYAGPPGSLAYTAAPPLAPAHHSPVPTYSPAPAYSAAQAQAASPAYSPGPAGPAYQPGPAYAPMYSGAGAYPAGPAGPQTMPAPGAYAAAGQAYTPSWQQQGQAQHQATYY